MTVKEYLNQARYLDMRINSKMQQVDSLNELATKATSTITSMPRNPSPATSLMALAIEKIVDLQAEINRDIDELVNLKQCILNAIKAVSNIEHQTILEKRYLCFHSWQKIAVAMDYDLRWLYRLHGKALEEVQKMLNEKKIS